MGRSDRPSATRRADVVSLHQLAKMMGWPRSTVHYWIPRAGIELIELSEPPYRFVSMASIDEAMFKLRQARTQALNELRTRGWPYTNLYGGTKHDRDDPPATD